MCCLRLFGDHIFPEMVNLKSSSFCAAALILAATNTASVGAHKHIYGNAVFEHMQVPNATCLRQSHQKLNKVEANKRTKQSTAIALACISSRLVLSVNLMVVVMAVVAVVIRLLGALLPAEHLLQQSVGSIAAHVHILCEENSLHC